MWAFIHFNQIKKFRFLIWETTQETPNVSLMKPIKTFLKRGFDFESDELDIVRVYYSACVSDLKRAGNLFFFNINSALRT